MENIPQSQKFKKSKKKIIYIVLASLVALCILAIAVFYFYPIPPSLSKMIKNGGTVERCIYSGGVGYFASVEAGDINTKIFYKPDGSEICSAGGLTGRKLEGACKEKLCFPIIVNSL